MHTAAGAQAVRWKQAKCKVEKLPFLHRIAKRMQLQEEPCFNAHGPDKQTALMTALMTDTNTAGDAAAHVTCRYR